MNAVSASVDMPTAPDAGANVNATARVDVDRDQRLAELAEIIQSYNAVTLKLQHSHEVLQAEVERLQEELAGKNAQLQRSKRLAALGEMAAGIAHEIRNPLAAIHLYARMLVEDLSAWECGVVPSGGAGDVKPQRETAEKIADAVRGLNAIVTDVLSFSREITPRIEAVPVEPMIARVLEAHRPAMDAASVDVSVEIAVESVQCDAQLMHQALLNIARNAVDAMATGAASERELRISVRAESGSAFHVITIADSGPGIEQDDIDRIFNPFFTTRNTGTGLGLAIVHRIVDAHGGNIRVSNDAGAVFEIRIPCSSADGRSGFADELRGDTASVECYSNRLRRSA